ncbi:serine hydrolase domain-containing protein [Shewanella waksmanii]|uniref:serine hydrolase domain-containing protein n=1 Tax=Shewanella waksmanii TaxID=213783 RepID=UPI0037368135
MTFIYNLRCAIATISLLCLSPWAAADTHLPATISSDDANALLKQIAQRSAFPFSGALIINQQGKTIAQKVMGKDIHIDSTFIIASQSKQITATLVMQAVEQGLIQLNVPINQYLASANEPAPYDSDITIHHLLCHTSGVTPIGKDNLFAAGSQFRYSNLGYELLAQILTNVSGQSYPQLLMKLTKQQAITGLYSQLGSLNEIKALQPLLVMGFHETHNTLEPSELNIDSALLPGGGLQASVTGLSQFMHQLHNQQLLDSKSYQQMITSHTERPHRWGHISYGYGLQISHQDDLTEYSHGGYLPGYSSLSLYYPQYQLTVLLLENVSLSLDDVPRAFALHDQLRQHIRQWLKNAEN